MHTVVEIKELLKAATYDEFLKMEASLKGDTRKGVQEALARRRSSFEREFKEQQRLEGLYEFEQELSCGQLVLGLDEVGRGPLAGPLAVGGVVLDPKKPKIEGLNDSKQIPETKRKALAEQIEKQSLASTVVMISPHDIDELGMAACLKKAFCQAIHEIDQRGLDIKTILLDGNPLHLDSRERNVIKGDARCASIAAASIIAKVARDQVMVELDSLYPGYGFASSKGYGSASHIRAIKEKGITPIHRETFCTAYTQPTLF